MKLTTHSGVPVYTISGSSTARPLPEWLARKRKRSLKADPEYANRVELLQDFEFEEASQCIRISEDGDWIMSTGTYKPQIHTHYLPQLSLSFARHTEVLNIKFQLLSSDYTKSIHLQSDRSLEFHTSGACHYKTRLPRYGRDLQYDKRSAEALVPSVGVNEDGSGEVFRLNLEVGRYMRSYEVDVGGDDLNSLGGGALQGGINTGSVNVASIAEESHNLYAFGTSLGTVEFFDPRSKNRAGILQTPQSSFVSSESTPRPEITALQFHRGGLTIATGTSTGLIYLYDLRSPKPLLKKDQGYGYPIQTLKFLTPSSTTFASASTFSPDDPKILSSDKRIIKIWSQHNGAPWTAVEPAVDLNDVAWYPDSGMLLTANEGRQQHAFFIPQLGPAPKWCSFLDNLVEEMADDPTDPNAFSANSATSGTGAVYDNYKFLTKPQLASLNLDHLIGTTSLLRPYMHGYFVAQKLYEEARLISDPFTWEEERAKKVKAKIDAERESRIRGGKKVTAKVNRRLAERLLEREERNERRRARRVLKKGGDDDMVDAETALQADVEAPAPEAEAEANDQPTQEKTGPRTLLTDSRFSKLFQDENFAIDETSHEFRQLNPSTNTATADNSTNLNPHSRRERGLTAVEQEELDSVSGSSSSESGSESDSEDDRRTRQHHQNQQQSRRNARNHTSDSEPDTNNKNRISSTSYKRSNHQNKSQSQSQSRPLKMQISASSSKNATNTNTNNKHLHWTNNSNQTFGSRISKSKSNSRSFQQQGQGQGHAAAVVGDQEITFLAAKAKGRSDGEGGEGGDTGRKRPRWVGGEGGGDRRSASGNVFRRL
ncbi:MAG: hypothetical protein M1834_006125 [Cirrosporium novae-zelandiae]|nr:MAG: hypothetical protein M1834_006125 [Cirrosporium novae-zelandiae]